MKPIMSIFLLPIAVFALFRAVLSSGMDMSSSL